MKHLNEELALGLRVRTYLQESREVRFFDLEHV